MRKFNVAGPCRPDWHYMIDAAARLPEVRGLVDDRAYFVVHAPRQTGKTTTLRALARLLTDEGRYAALCLSCEVAGALEEDHVAAQRVLLGDIRAAAELDLPMELRPPEPWSLGTADAPLSLALRQWASACPRPLVLFLDEIDALVGKSLTIVLQQLRAGYTQRPDAFPWSIGLCGMRDVRDYKLAAGGAPPRLGSSSPFNVKTESLRLANFTLGDIRELYGQHTESTGQVFTDEAVRLALELTAGQPWLINALGREVVELMNIPRSESITAEHIDAAKERLILARATHVDSLVARLQEDRVRRIIEPVIVGRAVASSTYDDDVGYVRDLGLVSRQDPLDIANPIYREVIVRVLAGSVQGSIRTEPQAFVEQGGRLSMDRLLDEFAVFWREHGEILSAGLPYHEAAPHLVLMAYLQRVVNGGGYVDREYGIGRGRVDVLVRWPYTSPDGVGHVQREALEIKRWAPKGGDPLDAGLAQLEEYLTRLGLDHGVLAIFDCREEGLPIPQRTRIEHARTPKGYPVRVLRG